METKTNETRYGRVHAKGNKTDPVYQDFLVRDERDGYLEYYHPQLNRWFNLPAEWQDKIRWDSE